MTSDVLPLHNPHLMNWGRIAGYSAACRQKAPSFILTTTCIKGKLAPRNSAPFSVTGRTAKTTEGASSYSLLGGWSVFHTTEYKAAVSTQLTLNSVLETGSPNGRW